MKRNINEITDFARVLARDSAAAILPFFRTDLAVQNKLTHDWDPVTEADKQAEFAMRSLITAHFPDDAIQGEEFGSNDGSSGYKWVLDPIDGTRAFVTGLPTWATLIGLYYEEKPVFGLMHQPFLGELFIGDGEQAYYERSGVRSPLRVSGCSELSSAKAGTTSPHLFDTLGFQTGFDRLRRECRLIRYSGDAYFFCMVAAGQLDIALDPGLQPYDIAALIPIIKGAGGLVEEWTGGDPSQGGNVLAAASRPLMDQATSLLTDRSSKI